ncbi:MAG: DNA alkylation repair protein [Methanosarcinales archaeon]|nr:DNA alkylation repair protein [Methanosarcinales archaeon]
MNFDVLFAVREELEQNADEQVKQSARRFFKDEALFLGVRTSVATKIAKKYFKVIRAENKQDIFALCENLLQSDYGEEAFIAFLWAYFIRERYQPEDFFVFQRWISQYVNNWAKCDTLCNHAVGSFIEEYPSFIENLKDWARSENRWLRRASAVTLILPARRGRFLEEVFQISDILLKDEEDLVQKGYGWMLKEASRAHQAEVFEYVMRNKKDMPRTALRYAIEKMPADMRKKAMAR